MRKRPLYLLILAVLYFSTSFGAISRIDSLRKKLQNANSDTTRMIYLLEIASAYNTIGNPNEEALNDAQEALALALKYQNPFRLTTAYYNLALFYENKGDNEKALDNFLKAIDVAEKNNLKISQFNTYSGLSNFYRDNMRNSKKALEYSLKGAEVAKQLSPEYDGLALANTGSIYYDINDFNQSLKYFLQAFDIMDSLKKRNDAATIANNIGSDYTELKEYDKAIEYYQKSLAIYNSTNDRDGEATALANIGNLYDMKNDAKQGVSYSLQALGIARQVEDKDLIAGIYGFLAEGYSKLNDFENAYKYQTYLANLKDTLFNQASSKQVNDMQVKYDTEKKDRENKILELSVNHQKLISYSIATGLILVIALVFFVYRGYVNKKKAHQELAEKNKIIEEKNKDILDSIHYAKTIQHAILTPEEYLNETLGEHFIVYKPRDVVSGDFYWCYETDNKAIFTVADCTGHGVPGAFMSMIGNSLLNEVVIEKRITDAAEILNNLRSNLLKTLVQKGQNTITRDGMDIALCVWDKRNNTLEYAGANNPIYLLRKNIESSLPTSTRVRIYGENLAELLPDKQPIGYYENRTNNPFSSHKIQLQKHDVIYISSDGYVDQFGGESGKKYTRKKFRETLISLTDKSLKDQKKILDETIENWKGSSLQTDDICLMGIKLG